MDKTSVPVKKATSINTGSDSNGYSVKKKKRRRPKKKGLSIGPSVSSCAVSNKKRNRNNKGSALNNSAPPPLVHLPHAKLTLRHIGNVDKHGNYSKMIDLIRNLIANVNASLLDGAGNGVNTDKSSAAVVLPQELSSIPMFLEESSVERILFIEKQLRRNQEVKPGKEGERQDDVFPDENTENSVAKSETEKKLAKKENGDSESSKQGAGNILIGNMVVMPRKAESLEKDVDIVESEEGKKDPMKKVYKNEISMRVLYMIPPRKSRRRGTITGHAYMVLHPPMPRFIVEKTNLSEDKGIIEIGNNIAPNTLASTGGNLVTAADRTKALAQSRLILRQTISNLSESCKAYTSKDAFSSGMMVELSPSQKIWKFEPHPTLSNTNNVMGKKGHYHVKYDSTIEQSDDFKAFLDKRTKEEEEIANRPKPPPGGGIVETTGGIDSMDSTGRGMEVNIGGGGMINRQALVMENGQPFPALVLHLREKKAAMQKSKSSSSSAMDMKSKKSSSGIGKGKVSTCRVQSIPDKKKGSKGGSKIQIGKSEGGSKKGHSSSIGGKKRQEKVSKKVSGVSSKRQNASQGQAAKDKSGGKSLGLKAMVVAPAKILTKPASSGGSNIKN